MTNPSEAVELLPCPFCGSKPVLEVCDTPLCNCGFQFLGCMNDGCEFQPEIDGGEHTTETAIAAWNRRAPQEGVEAVREKVVEILRDEFVPDGAVIMSTEPSRRRRERVANRILAALRPSPDSGGPKP